ncbi:MAG: adenosine kinase [Acidimicrobiales bacterium]
MTTAAATAAAAAAAAAATTAVARTTAAAAAARGYPGVAYRGMVSDYTDSSREIERHGAAVPLPEAPCRPDVLAIGHAIVDVVTEVDDAELGRGGLAKGTMTLVDGPTADRLYLACTPVTQACGGSAANTAVGVAALGGAATFLGRVADDPLGRVFEDDIEGWGVVFPLGGRAAPGPSGTAAPGPPQEAPGPAASVAGTGRCLVQVTPDAQRTMATYLGAAALLGPQDLLPSLLSVEHVAQVTYLEGYLLDSAGPRELLVAAARAATAAGSLVALSLSDCLLVERHGRLIRELMESGDIAALVGNEEEVTWLFEEPDLGSAMKAGLEQCEVVAATMSERGASVATASAIVTVPAVPVGQLIDTTGAGDLFAAGLLLGLARRSGRSPEELQAAATAGASLGVVAASDVISHHGAKPSPSLPARASLSGLLAQLGA